MGTYTYTQRENELHVTVDGQQVDLTPGQTTDIGNACQAIRFLNAVYAAGQTARDETTDHHLETLQAECDAISGGAGGGVVQTPPAPAPVTDPTSTDGGTPDDGVETAQTLGAPQVNADGGVSADPQVGADPDRPLNEQAHDPQNPLPEHDVADALTQQGVPASELPDALQGVMRNDPPVGEPHGEHGRDDRVVQDTVVDPVITFTGQYALTVVDLEIASRGMPLRLVRVYRSGTPYFGPWGYNWDHNYNVYLRELNNGGAAVWTGQLREEVYDPDPAGGFLSPTGVFRRLRQVAAGPTLNWVLDERDGTTLSFDRPAGWPHPTRIPLVRIEDRHGNVHLLTYDAEGRLSQVTDHAGRFIRFDYGDCALLEAVTDHTGRTWRYWHEDDVEHLVAVITPPAAGSPGGIVTHYEYDRFRTHPLLAHNIITVTDGAGRVIVRNEYGDEASSEDFARVVRQEYGGFEATFHAERLQLVPRTPDAINIPARRVEVVDPGIQFIYTFNYRGDLLDRRFRLTLDGSFRLVAYAYRYDEQGNLVEERGPDGRGFAYEYDEANVDPRARGNLLRMTELASLLKPAPAREALRATYEPVAQQVKTMRDAAGNVTTYTFDYEVAPFAGSALPVEIRYPAVTLPDGTVRQHREAFKWNGSGQLLEHAVAGGTSRFTYGGAGPMTGYLVRREHTGAGSTVREDFEYDAIGNVVARIDGLGNRRLYQVDALGHTTRSTSPVGASWDFEYDAAGRIRAVVAPRGAYDDAVLAGQPIRHELEFDEMGFLVRSVEAANTAAPAPTTFRRDAEGHELEVVDPVGRRVRRRLDERGLALSEEIFEADGTLVRRREFVYSTSGELTASLVDGGPAVRMEYDGFGQPVKATAPDGTEFSYAFDQRALAVQCEVHGAGGGPLLARRRWERDERGMVRRLVDVLFDNPAGPFTDVVTETWRDDLGRAERVVDPAGFRTERVFNPLGVVLEERDALGNAVVNTLDAAGQCVRVAVTEVDAAGTATTAAWTRTFDADGRITSESDPLGNTTSSTCDERGMVTSATNAIGQAMVFGRDALGRLTSQGLAGATMRYDRDAAGRIVRAIDPGGGVTRMEYDALDRTTRVVRPDGSVQRFTFDATGSLGRFVDGDGSIIDYVNSPTGLPTRLQPTPSATAAPSPTVTLAYDGLRRITQATAGPIAHSFRYDSLGRVLSESGPDIVGFQHSPAGDVTRVTYPDGRRDRHDLDAAGRLASVTLEADGMLGLAAQGVPVGSALSGISWAGYGRPAQVDALGAVTKRFEYDGARRVVGTDTRDSGGTTIFSERYVRDGIGRPTLAASGVSAREFRFDAQSHLVLTRDGLPAAAVPAAATLTQAQMDAATAAAAGQPATRQTSLAVTASDLPSTLRELDGGGAVLSTRTFTETATRHIATVDGVVATYDGAGNLRQLGAREYRYDAYRRLVEVRDGGVTTARITYDGMGRVHTREDGTGAVSRFAYAGDELIQVSGAAGVELQLTPGVRLDEPVLASTTSATHPLVHDALGSLRVACDSAGAVLERYRYSAYGVPSILAPDDVTVRAGSALGIAPRFHGRPWLAGVGLYDFRDRYYDPALLVFLQPDPFLMVDSWSPYSFAHYNPVTYRDPFGRWLHILAGAIIGAAIGGIGAALSGGDWKDILVGIGAGAAGGAITAATGNPALGGAVAGGLMGAWAGGRAGYRMGGAEGAVAGALIGGTVGAALGAASGHIGGRVGNRVATGVSGALTRSLTGTLTSRSVENIARYGGQIAGGYAGGATGSLVGNNGATLVTDVVTGRPVEAGQFWDASVHALTIDGALGAVGAPSERLLMLRGLPGNRSNVLGAEGELLVGREYGLERANGTEDVTNTPSGNDRRTDFLSTDTIPEHGAVFEVKNKMNVTDERGGQVSDLADFAQQQGADLWVFIRPGANVTQTVSGIANVRIMPIPQQPLVVVVPGAGADFSVPK